MATTEVEIEPQNQESCKPRAEMASDDPELCILGEKVDHKRCRYPYAVVWTPIPLLTWLFPFIGHMGIAMSSGVIRDFAGPYYVSEDHMAFGRPTKYWTMSPSKAKGGTKGWDSAVGDASEEYKHHMHNLFCDNCHSHVALALNTMQYDRSTSWNMVKLCFLMLIYGKYVSVCAFLKTWLPFLILGGGVVALALLL
ncbi:PREDICTED: transmembrane protein 222-like [Branchiostoma belcheri]|uniref:Transmembrane protein 222-like n=1 Tax=Branchiostoma belcheri TaxID=7741 RepID=A0A6P5AYD8_BRABE|nr:PREDICTED: transmembrane protein 222-like [Branchiostoma belcheri]